MWSLIVAILCGLRVVVTVIASAGSGASLRSNEIGGGCGLQMAQTADRQSHGRRRGRRIPTGGQSTRLLPLA